MPNTPLGLDTCYWAQSCRILIVNLGICVQSNSTMFLWRTWCNSHISSLQWFVCLLINYMLDVCSYVVMALSYFQNWTPKLHHTNCFGLCVCFLQSWNNHACLSSGHSPQKCTCYGHCHLFFLKFKWSWLSKYGDFFPPI